MEHIERVSGLKREALSGDRYLESLLVQAHSLGMLSDGEVERIQFDLLALLAKRTERFNAGDSSSIRVEKAQGILASVLYIVGVQLKTHPTPDEAVAALQKEQVEELYHRGRKRIDSLVKRTKLLHATLLPKLIETENDFYHSTAVEGIQGFFKLYDPDFAAQEIHITADYPVYNPAQELAGIEFIQSYLERFSYENLFCAQFAPEDVHHLLRGYDEGYQSLLFNLYEPVLAAALGCTLTGADPRRLTLTPAALDCLQGCFSGQGEEEIERILTKALTELSERLSLSQALQGYVRRSLPLLANTVEAMTKTGALGRVFILPRYPEHTPKLAVAYGEKMDNELYRKVLEEFMGAQSMTDKMDIIHEKVSSLADLSDLLQDAEPTPGELAAILKSLTPAEIAVLLKKHTPEHGMSPADLRDSERALYGGLQRFQSDLPPKEQELLLKMVEVLELT